MDPRMTNGVDVVISTDMSALSVGPSSLDDVRKALEHSTEKENQLRRKKKTQSLPNMQRHWKSKIDFDEVYPRIFISGSNLAKNKTALRDLGITHVLNMAQGSSDWLFVDTNADFYKRFANFHQVYYKGVSAADIPSQDLKRYWMECSEWIHNALTYSDDSKVLVHCLMGISRSSSTVAAYLIRYQGMNAANAIRMMRHSRYIYPNSGFQKQLVEFNEIIWNEQRFTVMSLALLYKVYRRKETQTTPRKNQSAPAFVNGTTNGKATETPNSTANRKTSETSNDTTEEDQNKTE